MLRKIIAENLKSIGQRQEAPLSKITLIFGPNSAGKSSLIQGLLLMKQTLDDPDPQRSSLIARGPLVDLGSFTALIHEHNVESALTLGIQFDRDVNTANRRVASRIYGRDLRTVELTFGARRQNQATRQKSVTLMLDGSLNSCFTRQSAPRRLAEEGISQRNADVFTFDDKRSRDSWRSWLGKEWEESQQRIARHRTDLKTAPMPEILTEDDAEILFGARGVLPGPIIRPSRARAMGDEADPPIRLPDLHFYWDRVSSGFFYEVSALMQDIAYLGPLRRPPERFEIFSGATRTNVGRTGEYATEILASSSNQKELLGNVNDWLRRLDIPYMLEIRDIGDASVGDAVALVLRDERRKLVVSPTDVGFGISQLLPIVVQCLSGRNVSICVEQPEIHAHPRLQAVTADLFIAATKPPFSNQIIAETHSEHLVLRLQRRIREGQLDSSDVSVLYVDPSAEGRAIVKQLQLDEDGDFITEWPSGFFDERLSEL